MTQNILRTALATGMTVWAYERHGIMLGAVCIRKQASASVIAHIAVRPFRRGYGIGGKLLRHAERHAGSPLLVRLDAGAIWTIRFFREIRISAGAGKQLFAYARYALGNS